MSASRPGPVRVQLLHVPDCPLTGRVRDALYDCIRHVGFSVRVEELEGAYPSPTLVVDGIDVATGARPSREICCRLDVPTCAQIVTALNRAARTCAEPASSRGELLPRF
jgi:hypothetical protein